MKPSLALFLAFALLASGCLSSPSLLSKSKYATVTFSSNSTSTVLAEVAADEASRSRGLMFRDSLEDGKGMLFAFPYPAQYSFYMKNTKIPLDLIYIENSSGSLSISKIRRSFTPCTADPCELDWSPQHTLYVLEVPANWTARQGIDESSAVSINFVY